MIHKKQETCDRCGATNNLQHRGPEDENLFCPVCYACLDLDDALQGELLTTLKDWQARRQLTDKDLWRYVGNIATSSEHERDELRTVATGG